MNFYSLINIEKYQFLNEVDIFFVLRKDQSKKNTLEQCVNIKMLVYRLKQAILDLDLKNYYKILEKKCDTIVVLKLSRLTRSVFDWEKIIRFLEENDAYLDCANDDINTTNTNGKMF